MGAMSLLSGSAVPSRPQSLQKLLYAIHSFHQFARFGVFIFNYEMRGDRSGQSRNQPDAGEHGQNRNRPAPSRHRRNIAVPNCRRGDNCPPQAVEKPALDGARLQHG